MESNNISYILQSAILAPSGHNSQPWKFKVDYNVIRIYPDYSRRLPAVDPHNRELFISLGCALENLVIAARARGYSANVQLFPPDEKEELIRIVLENAIPKHDPLCDAIPKRQSNRQKYSGRVIPQKELEQIKTIEPYPNVRVDVFPRSVEFENIVELILAGNTIQMSDEAFKTELVRWIRFNAHEKQKFRDGLCYDVMGFPALPGFIGRMVIKEFLKPDKQNKEDAKKLASSAALLLFSTSEYSKTAWVNLGRTFERIALQTTLLGIAHAHVNQPVEINSLNQKLANIPGLVDYYPSLMIRLGYADRMPISPRRSVEQVLIKE